MMANIGMAAYPSPPYFNSPPSHHNPSSGLSPTAMASLQGQQSSQDFAGHDADNNSPLSMNADLLKSLNEKKTRDGNPQKRRGPKPDSKPALTRRQELNRQAQRTHRERKELYIKALEDEVLRLKEVYSNVSQDKVRLAEENRRLKAMMSGRTGSSLIDDVVSNPSIGYSGSVSGSAVSHGPSSNTSVYTTPPPLSSTMGGPGMGLGVSRQNPKLDYDQAGIDFVLHLEQPCMTHMPWLLDRSAKPDSTSPCGHALMASCPPEPFLSLTPEVPFGFSNVTGSNAAQTDAPGAVGQRTWELTKADLATLLELSARLNLDGEITPVMAWGMVLAHPRLGELRVADFARLAEELGGKVRCYGFGAVMEEFEVRDALENILSVKPDLFHGINTANMKGDYVLAF